MSPTINLFIATGFLSSFTRCATIEECAFGTHLNIFNGGGNATSPISAGETLYHIECTGERELINSAHSYQKNVACKLGSFVDENEAGIDVDSMTCTS
jgi:hypothetical protein